MAVRFLVVVLLAAVTTSIAQDYCKLCADHTMCKYKGDGPNCGTVVSSGVSSAAQAVAINAHNTCRQKLAEGKEPNQPAAANMHKMTWDPQLAAIAQRWADQCTFGHDTCRKDSRFFVGQNVFMMTGSTVDPVIEWQHAVDAWYSEVKLFSSANINPFKYSDPVGHYTQVAWADSKFLGCGFKAYKNVKMYVCNYGPAGNVNGKIMYKTGTACSQCPKGTTCSSGLCA